MVHILFNTPHSHSHSKPINVTCTLKCFKTKNTLTIGPLPQSSLVKTPPV
ncbi:hypothetical protein HanPSC8_Chr10g0449771 [Helianthus annuus]|nr:hypothetical protein HanPSC8_Chr10g0449771 [Helianthus annuus]